MPLTSCPWGNGASVTGCRFTALCPLTAPSRALPADRQENHSARVDTNIAGPAQPLQCCMRTPHCTSSKPLDKIYKAMHNLYLCLRKRFHIHTNLHVVTFQTFAVKPPFIYTMRARKLPQGTLGFKDQGPCGAGIIRLERTMWQQLQAYRNSDVDSTVTTSAD